MELIDRGGAGASFLERGSPSIEAPQALRRGAVGAKGWGLGGGIPFPSGKGSGEGVVPSPQKKYNFLPRKDAFWVHFDSRLDISQGL